jgi:predicted nucleic acid-binding protein
VIYLDAAAVVKIVRAEPETTDLVKWLNEHPDAALVSSVLVEVEVPRALRRSAPQALIGVAAALSRLYRVEIDATIRATAAAYEDGVLRTLDAIHLATAQVLSGRTDARLEAFVTYDKRLLSAAHAVGLPIASPGVIE